MKNIRSHVRYDIQGLRAIAVVAVTLFHFRVPGFQGGYVGVDIFFVISGFLMTSMIATKLERGAFKYSEFLCSRALRIYPPMLALILAVLIFGYFFLNPGDYEALAKNALSAVASLCNVRFYMDSLNYFAPAQQTNWLLHLWSLAVEVQFYFLYPLLLWVGYIPISPEDAGFASTSEITKPGGFLRGDSFSPPLNSTGYTARPQNTSRDFLRDNALTKSSAFKYERYIPLQPRDKNHTGQAHEGTGFVHSSLNTKLKRARAVLIITILVSLAVSVILTAKDQSASFFLLPSRVWEFAAGGLIFAYADRIPNLLRKSFSLGGLCLIASSIFTYRETMAFPGWIAFLPVMGAAMVIAARRDDWILSNGAMQILGRISYSVYLWHWPVWVFSQQYRVPVTFASTCVLIFASLGLGAVSYYLIERTVNQVRHTTLRKLGSMTVTGFACIAIGFSASTVVAKQGFPNRVPEIIRNVVPHFKSDIVKRTRFGVCFLELGQGPNDFTDKCFTRKLSGARSTVFIWGDSYAAHLWFGLDAAPGFERINLLGTTSPGCFPVLDAPSKFNSNCTDNNNRTIAEIDRVKPDTVILHGRWIYAETDLFDIIAAISKTVDYLSAKGIHVIVVGPNPEWMPALSQRLLQESFARGGVIPDIMVDASQKSGWLLDQKMADALSAKKVKYVSLYKLFCSDKGCRTTVPKNGGRELMVYDYGHLTVPAAEFIVRSSFNDLVPVKPTESAIPPKTG